MGTSRRRTWSLLRGGTSTYERPGPPTEGGAERGPDLQIARALATNIHPGPDLPLNPGTPPHPNDPIHPTPLLYAPFTVLARKHVIPCAQAR
ncbi:protein of unknown function [Streptomyces murinus]